MAEKRANSAENWRLIGECSEGGELAVDLVPPKIFSIGRSPERTIHLLQKGVSRLHAELHWAAPVAGEEGRWRIRDCGSTLGTFVNGVKLGAQQEVRIDHGDRVLIKPWKLRVEGPPSERTVAEGSMTVVGGGSDDDASFEAVAAVQSPAELAQGMLVHLYAATSALMQAGDGVEVAQVAVDALMMATGFPNVAFLRPGPSDGSFELMAHNGDILEGTTLRFSRSLLKRARNGVYAWKEGQGGSDTLQASIASLAIRQAIVVPVDTGGVFHGWLYLDTRAGSGIVSHQEEAAGFANAIGNLVGLSLSNLERGKMQQRFELETRELMEGNLWSLVEAIDAKDEYTQGHSLRVAQFAKIVAKQMGLASAEVDRIHLCGLVHDVGKIGVPEEILRKPSRLTEEEFERIKQHPERGVRILQKANGNRDILPGVLDHHERWDGSGYPNKLSGKAISLFGRVLCVADSFDAMTTARAYRPAKAIAVVREEIRKCLGTHFDPEIGETFLSIRDSVLETVIHGPRPVAG